jgi:hypothetical protein
MFESEADQHINDLIKKLCAKAATRMDFVSEADERQIYIDQIAKLRASQNPIINLPQ